MATHLFAIGEIVSLSFDQGQLLAKLNPFTVEAQMPPVGTLLQYRVKSEAEACRRVVPEHQLTSCGPQPAPEPVTVVASDEAAIR